MQPENGQSRSLWMDGAEVPTFPPLREPALAEICVVGAGIAGLTTAYLLARDGRQVIVVDDGAIGGGESGRTTAQLTCILDRGYAETEQLRGRDGARLAAHSHRAAIDMIEQIVREESIDCDFMRVDGYLFLGADGELQELTDELAAAQQAGIADVELVGGLPVPSLASGPALRFPRQAQFHILKYLSGLARAAVAAGAKIFSGTHVTKVLAGAPLMLETSDGHTISAGSVVLATNAPINDALGYSTRAFPYRTYVVGLPVPRGAVPPMLAFDTEDPYHYIRTQPGPAGQDILLVGGEDHKTGQEDDAPARYARLEAWAREHFPAAGPATYRWSGQVIDSLDGLALIGPDLVTPGVYVITGDTGMGMTHSTIAGLLLTDLLAGRPNVWAELYDPARLPLSSLGDVAREGLNVAAQLGDLLGGGDVTNESQIAPDSGAVISRGLSKYAVYRDSAGVLHRRSANCTHLGCIVHWNDGEKSWDCPCHGSRYTALGRVVNGPAPTDLAPAD